MADETRPVGNDADAGETAGAPPPGAEATAEGPPPGPTVSSYLPPPRPDKWRHRFRMAGIGAAVLAVTFLAGYLVGANTVEPETEVVEAAADEDDATDEDEGDDEAGSGFLDEPEETTATTTAAEPEEAALTGSDVEFRVRWTSDDLFNLFVAEPSGQVTSYETEVSNTGGTFDPESWRGTCGSDGEKFQRIAWDGSAPTGTYEVYVMMDQCPSELVPSFFSIEVVVDGEVVEEFQDTLGEDQLDDMESEAYTFELTG